MRGYPAQRLWKVKGLSYTYMHIMSIDGGGRLDGRKVCVCVCLREREREREAGETFSG